MATSNKNEDRLYVQCLQCKNASAFLQWFSNPIIAVCGERGDRQVAATKRICKLFIRAKNEELPPVQHFDHYDD